jgi:hypothetical protein
MVSGTRSVPTPWVMLSLTAGLLLLAGAISYLGTGGALLHTAPSGSNAPPLTGPVVTIDLPYADPDLPLGPHQEQLAVSCTICHSPRLVLTQPFLTRKQWEAVVHKMVATYGAPIRPSDETAIVTYLVAIRGSSE